MTIEAYFIDGQTSKRRACLVTLQDNSISIVYHDDSLQKLNSTWQVDAILRQDLRSSSNYIKYGDFPHQVLEFKSEQDLSRIIEYYPEALFHRSAYNKFSTFGWKGMVSALVGVIIVAVFFFIYGVPFIADSFARSIPKEYETYIGNNFRQTYLQYQTIDTLRSEQIQQFYNHMNLESDYDISVVVVDSKIINAFALPGGYIVVFSGLLEMLEEEDELAGLLAHEASHINERHSLRLISKDLAMYVLFASLTGDVGGFSSILIENSNLVSSLSYSRNFEKEADLEGFDLLVNSEINPKGMISLFAKFGSINSKMERELAKKMGMDSTDLDDSSDTTKAWYVRFIENVPEILSTHPIPENRIKYLEEEMSKLDPRLTFPENDSLKLYFDKLLKPSKVLVDSSQLDFD
jgi:Zn-dependent protease with chaperone function